MYRLLEFSCGCWHPHSLVRASITATVFGSVNLFCTFVHTRKADFVPLPSQMAAPTLPGLQAVLLHDGPRIVPQVPREGSTRVLGPPRPVHPLACFVRLYPSTVRPQFY